MAPNISSVAEKSLHASPGKYHSRSVNMKLGQVHTMIDKYHCSTNKHYASKELINLLINYNF